MGPPNGANFLRNANGTGAHSYAKAIDSGINEILCLSSRYISTDYLREGNEGGNKQKEGRNKKRGETKSGGKQKEGGNKKRE